MEAMPSSSRKLFRAALVIFVITVVIGILNGIDVWDPPRNTLLAHVHAAVNRHAVEVTILAQPLRVARDLNPAVELVVRSRRIQEIEGLRTLGADDIVARIFEAVEVP